VKTTSGNTQIYPKNTNYLNLFTTRALHFESRRTIYSHLNFGVKNSSFRLPYQRPTSSTDCARELFNVSNGSASLVDCTRKQIFWLGSADFLWLTS